MSPEVGTFAWAPVLDFNITMPVFDGWREKDWHFLRETPEELIRKGHFNPNLRYMSGVTTQEAAFFISKLYIQALLTYLSKHNRIISGVF